MLPTSTYVVLGLLAKVSPLSGYDITSLADRSVAHFWSISRTLVYRELARLEEMGYVEADIVVQERLPDKRMYSPTPDGLAALDEWLAHPSIPATNAKDGFLVKFFFSDRMSDEHLDSLLAEYRESSEAKKTDLQAIADHLAEMPGGLFGYMTARYGVFVTEAQLRWLDEVEAVVKHGPRLVGLTRPAHANERTQELVDDVD